MTTTRDPMQPIRALERANAVRMARSSLKRIVASSASGRDSRRTAAGLIVGPTPPFAERMEVRDLVRAVPQLGDHRMRTMLRRAGVPPLATLGDLTDRQRHALAAELTSFPTQHPTTGVPMITTPYGRQGDILIERVDRIPEGLIAIPRENGRIVLAHGEVTGHAHVVDGEATLLATDLREMDERFLRVEADAAVRHDEHAAITLPPGDYRIARQREYAPEAPVRVAD